MRPDLSDIDKTQLERHVSPSGEPYYRVFYELEMSFDVVISFALRYEGMKTFMDYQLC